MTLSQLSPATLGAAEFRHHFPALERMTYLAACSSGPPSPHVAEALLRSEAVDGLGWPQWEHEVAAARAAMATSMHTTDAHVAAVPDATLGAHQVTAAVDWEHRPRLLSSRWDFPSLRRVWRGCVDRGAEPELVDNGGGPATAADLTERYLEALDERTGLVSIPWADYRTGARLDVPAIGARARELGATVFVDAYQVAGTLVIDVADIGCDYLVTGTGKYLLGRPGMAFLYVRDPGRRPTITGWQGSANPFDDDADWSSPLADDARSYQIGTPAVSAAYAARAGLELLSAASATSIRSHISGLVDATTDLLTEAGHTVATSAPADRGAVVAVVDPNAGELAGALYRDDRVVVSPRGDVVRAAFHFYNSADDVVALCAALSRQRSPR